MRILLVDDSKILQERILSIINECDFVQEVDQAYNTLEAKEKLIGSNYDLVISDIRMPGGGGLELLQFIKERQPDTKVIIMTNYPYPQYQNRASELGAEYFLSKNEELENLANIICELNSPDIESNHN